MWACTYVPLFLVRNMGSIVTADLILGRKCWLRTPPHHLVLLCVRPFYNYFPPTRCRSWLNAGIWRHRKPRENFQSARLSFEESCGGKVVEVQLFWGIFLGSRFFDVEIIIWRYIKNIPCEYIQIWYINIKSFRSTDFFKSSSATTTTRQVLFLWTLNISPWAQFFGGWEKTTQPVLVQTCPILQCTFWETFPAPRCMGRWGNGWIWKEKNPKLGRGLAKNLPSIKDPISINQIY